MPRQQVYQFLRRKAGADIEHILGMADRFDVSREAAARRYVVHRDELVAVVFSQDNRIRYVKSNEDFPRLSVWNGDLLPTGSLSLSSQAAVGHVSGWVEVHSHAWLESSRGFMVCEQTLSQQKGFRMTLLTVERDENEDDAWEPPRFRR